MSDQTAAPTTARSRILRSPNLHDQLIVNLRTMIMEGELAPGMRIPEQRLCSLFDVSRTPLREALKVLAWEGLVDMHPNRGSSVAGIGADETASLFELKYGLEDLAGQLIPIRITNEELAKLESLHTRMVDAHRNRDRAGYFATNLAIHQALVDAAHNEPLSVAYESLALKIARVRVIANRKDDRWDRSVREHESIMAALRAGDALRLAERMRTHNRLTAEAVLHDLSITMAAREEST